MFSCIESKSYFNFVGWRIIRYDLFVEKVLDISPNTPTIVELVTNTLFPLLYIDGKKKHISIHQLQRPAGKAP